MELNLLAFPVTLVTLLLLLHDHYYYYWIDHSLVTHYYYYYYYWNHSRAIRDWLRPEEPLVDWRILEGPLSDTRGNAKYAGWCGVVRGY